MQIEKEILIDHPSDRGSQVSSSDHACPQNVEVSVSDSPGERRVPSGGGIVYLSFLILGLGTLLPWNFLINADSYWQYKFRNTSDPSGDWEKRETLLQNLFNPFLVSFSQTSSFFFLLVNSLFGHMFPKQTVLVSTLVIMVLSFMATTTLAKIDTDTWELQFFIGTMGILIVINACVALFLGGLYGIAAKFPHKFINAVNVGQALGGVFASISRIISIYFGADEVASAFIYFLIAVLVLVIILVDYVLVSRTEFFKFFAHSHTSSEEEDKRTRGVFEFLKDEFRIFRKVWLPAVAVSFVFFVSLSIFPSVCVKVISMSKNKVWADKYFQPVATFLLFNVCDYLGRVVSEYLLWPITWLRSLCWLSFLRIVFIPLILLCAHNPDSSIPSLLNADYCYVVLIILLSFTNGYSVSVIMMHAPKIVPESESEKVGGMMATMIGLGLLLGSFVSFALAILC